MTLLEPRPKPRYKGFVLTDNGAFKKPDDNKSINAFGEQLFEVVDKYVYGFESQTGVNATTLYVSKAYTPDHIFQRLTEWFDDVLNVVRTPMPPSHYGIGT